MSVFTPLQRDELEAFLAPYRLGRLRDFQGIAAGSENSNFFISLEQGEYVLTLIERGPRQEALEVFERVRGGVEGYLWVQAVTGAMICVVAWGLMREVGLQ